MWPAEREREVEKKINTELNRKYRIRTCGGRKPNCVHGRTEEIQAKWSDVRRLGRRGRSAAFTSGVHAHKVSSMYTLNGAGIKVERGKRHRKNREENKYVIDVKMSPNVEKVSKIVSTSGKSWGREKNVPTTKEKEIGFLGLCVGEIVHS